MPLPTRPVGGLRSSPVCQPTDVRTDVSRDYNYRHDGHYNYVQEKTPRKLRAVIVGLDREESRGPRREGGG